MGRPKEKFEAFIVGVHDLPAFAKNHLDAEDGDVVVHNITRDQWSVIPWSTFDRLFEWA